MNIGFSKGSLLSIRTIVKFNLHEAKSLYILVTWGINSDFTNLFERGIV